MLSSAVSKDHKFESRRSRPANPTATAPPSSGVGVIDETLAQELHLQKLEDDVQHRTQWQIKGSSLSLNTHNRIRNIVEALQIKPNPQKPMIPLSIGEFLRRVDRLIAVTLEYFKIRLSVPSNYRHIFELIISI